MKMLNDFYTWKFSDNEGFIAINGKDYEYQISLDSSISDSECMRVNINGEYYYFG